MTLTRRRFMTVSAAFACAPNAAHAHSWKGRAFGADIAITIRGGADAAAALRDARRVMSEVEALFNLYDPSSALSRLNADGHLEGPEPWFLELMTAADRVHKMTDGLFDPTVQRLWKARAAGRVVGASGTGGDWGKVKLDARRIVLGKSQALTFNGIAQGFATDKVTEVLRAHGLGDVLVNIGEHRGVGGPWRLELSDPVHGSLGMRTLTTGAIATSSPNATPLPGGGHIVHPTARPQWSTVSVEAASAVLADGLSTALVLAPLELVKRIVSEGQISRVTLVDRSGDLTTFSA
ncbi:FAD:protein FMN transferase [Litoreibacter albidus]|uniref:FAD:protein FMN transferase n=1 Tax=Litoreibacter albidus TaxID=670155 RepID=UPI003735FDF7